MKNILPAEGKLGILLPGLGAVATTAIAGVIAIRQGKGKPIGSLTQIGRIRIGKRDENKLPFIRDVVKLVDLSQIVFGGWDIFNENAYEVALRSQVLKPDLLAQLKGELEQIRPMKGAFDKSFVKKLDGNYIKTSVNKMDLAEQLCNDIRSFKEENNCQRLVMIWCGSTEVYTELTEVHMTIDAFEEGLKNNHPLISPSMIYAYAALKEGVPYANGAPHYSQDIPALEELAIIQKVAIAGKDFKTGQTLLKSIIAPGLKARMLGINGWFSTNILGNRDGEVLDDPGSFKSKEVSKLSVLESILEPEIYPDLYENLYHKVRINFYPPRGDNKESWDNVDIIGWLGYKMQIKINFLCRDSILAAPIVLDLALFLDLAQRSGFYGIQEWLSFYFKFPHCRKGLKPVNDLFEQREKLFNTLRFLAGEKLIHHLGLTYYGVDEEKNL